MTKASRISPKGLCLAPSGRGLMVPGFPGSPLGSVRPGFPWWVNPAHAPKAVRAWNRDSASNDGGAVGRRRPRRMLTFQGIIDVPNKPPQASERDRVLLRMLKTPPKQHKADRDADDLAGMIEGGSLDIEKMARLTSQTDPNKNFGKKQRK